MIRILTFPDPYTISQTEAWNELRDSPWFCASQVMANSVSRLYQEAFLPGQISTVARLAQALFPEWTDTTAVVLLNVTIERYLQEMGDKGVLNENELHVWLANRPQAAQAISALIDFGIRPEDIPEPEDRPDQKLLITIYKRLLQDKRFQGYLNESPVMLEAQIDRGLKEQKEPGDYRLLGRKKLVFAGIHQFTPLILRALHALEEEYDLIFLMNYRKDYANIYQTWLTVYQEMPARIEIESDTPVSSGSLSTRFGASFGRIYEGQITPEMFADQIELIEFDNNVSFAHYVAERFEQARRINPENPLSAMDEKFYSANMDVNQILQVYFPEQFEEKNFLNYPIGQFFLGMAQLWNSEKKELAFTEEESILKLLGTGVVPEKKPGQLISAMYRILPYVRQSQTLDEMIERAETLRDLLDDGEDFQEHLDYFQVSEDDLSSLIESLEWIREISEEFFDVFENGAGNFSEFYQKLDQFIHNTIEEDKYMHQEMIATLEQVSQNLKKLENLRINGSLETLTRTMDLFLTEDSKDQNSARWIVKGFPQIEGDILHSQSDSSNTVYHFACLSDEEILKKQNTELWPLNSEFWQALADRNDWRIRLYQTSCEQCGLYEMFCLFYGLFFNKRKFRISYVKNRQNQRHYPLYLFRLLNCQINPQAAFADSTHGFSRSPVLPEGEHDVKEYGLSDYYNYVTCPYRFQLVSNADQTFRYRSLFQIEKYLSLRISQETGPQSMPGSDRYLRSLLENKLNQKEEFFPILFESEKEDVIKDAKQRLSGKNDQFAQRLFKDGVLLDPRWLNGDQKEELSITDDEQIQETIKASSTGSSWNPAPDRSCLYCPVREICLASFISRK